MSIPPQIIRVKRKKEDSPLDTLHFEADRQARHGAKRLQTEQFVFKLEQRAEPSELESEKSRDLSRSDNNQRFIKSLEIRDDVSEDFPHQGGSAVPPQTQELPSRLESTVVPIKRSYSNTPPRRFHLSRIEKHTIPEKILNSHRQRNKILKYPRPKAPIFTERHARASLSRQRSKQGQVDEDHEMQDQTETTASGRPDHSVPLRKTPATRDRHGRDQHQSRHDVSGQTQAEVDPSVLQIFAEMQKEYENGLNDHSKLSSERQTSGSRFKPKFPAKRYHERYPEVAQSRMADDSMDLDITDDNDYVYDTYVRHRIDKSITHGKGEMLGNGPFGILVIDEDKQSLWEEFVDGEEDSDKEWNSDDEDENAEDYYGADYPEDEVDTDDEYDTGAYNYRHNASDDEEYGSETGAWSDDEELRHPWRKLTRPRDPDEDDNPGE